jgi:hypothetical protein
MMTHTDPKLSVIVVCLNNARVLERCLAALRTQSKSSDVEVLAVGRWIDESDHTKLRERFSQVHWIDAPKEDTVPLMRTRGIAASHGAIIALLEDDCVVADGWCQGIIDAHQANPDAIGGAIEPGDDYKNIDWAVYFCEYARFMAPFAGAVSALPGNNVSYKRAVVSDLINSDGLYDVFFHWQLQQSGKILVADPRLIVYNANHWSLAHVTSSPFHHGRAFAGMRARNFSRWKRIVYAGLAPGLVFVKVARVAREVLSRRKHIKEFLLSLPWTILFMLSWSFGEFLGYVFGAGDSAARWQ